MARSYVTAAVVMIVILIGTPLKVESEITCPQVLKLTASCITYAVKGRHFTSCCNGIKAVAAATKTTNERRAVCRCLKAASNIPNGAPESLAIKCKVKVPYGITPSPSTNCNTIP